MVRTRIQKRSQYRFVVSMVQILPDQLGREEEYVRIREEKRTVLNLLPFFLLFAQISVAE